MPKEINLDINEEILDEEFEISYKEEEIKKRPFKGISRLAREVNGYICEHNNTKIDEKEKFKIKFLQIIICFYIKEYIDPLINGKQSLINLETINIEKKDNIVDSLINLFDLVYNSYEIMEKEYKEAKTILEKWKLKKPIDEEMKILKKFNISTSKEAYKLEKLDIHISEKKDEIKKIKDYIMFIIDMIDETYKEHNAFKISLSKNGKLNYKKLDKIIDSSKLFEINLFNDIFTIEYDINKSTGEQAILTTFSRIYNIIIKDKLKYEKIILLLDEPDIYMHPEWQRKFLSMFIEFIQTTFEGKKFQIILTSHSPFVASDLPRENIIFLDKDDNGKCKVVNSSEKKKTFGANIHTLLSDGFFMESSLGEFARSKISWVMETLNKDIADIRKDEKKIKEIIEMIGEPIIKTKLMKMLEDKLKLNLIGVNDRIRKLEIEIEELKKLKGE